MNGSLRFFVVISNLVQRHVWQAGSHVTGLLLWIGHCVAVQSQQLLQRKLTGLQRVTEGDKDRKREMTGLLCIFSSFFPNIFIALTQFAESL